MNLDDIAHARLANQRLSWTDLTTPAEVVARLVAVQAQDFAAAKWALGQRLPPTTDAAVERAFNDGAILRTHVLRPTWHFVTPDDIRPLLTLTAARVHQVNAGMYRQVGMGSPTLHRSLDAVTGALAGGRPLTRDELGDALRQAGIELQSGLPTAYVMMNAELEGLICSGPRRGKQFTYMLLDERAPGGRKLARDEALVEVSRRYFVSHGPATAADFANWSGLRLTEARRGLAAVAGELQQATVEGQTYWFGGETTPDRAAGPRAWLLSIYDETIIGYKDRSAIVSAADGARLMGLGNALQAVVVIDGRVAGTWRREVMRGRVVIELNPFRDLTEAEHAAVDMAAARLGAFLRVEPSLHWAE